jgi:hypothetical protein
MKAISDCRSKFQSFYLDAKLLNTLLPDRAEHGTRYKVCVMCRRTVEIRFHGSFEGSNHLQGHQLTICGCSYCRECFRSSAEHFADCGEPIQCCNCKRQVLAKYDCQKIIGPNYKDGRDQYQQHIVNIHEKEWMNLLRKSERKYCAEILVAGGEYSDISTCPDCGSHSVFHNLKPFFRCSAIHCSNAFCCRCLRVTSSLTPDELKTCTAGKCKRDEE